MINKLFSSTAILTFSFAGIGFLAIRPVQAGCNFYGCSQSSVAECNFYGCPNPPMGEKCNFYGCPESPIPQSQPNNNSNSNNNSSVSNNSSRSDFQFCVEQYVEENYSTSYAIQKCEHLR